MRATLAMLVVAFAAATAVAGASTVRSGLYGSVTRGPISPVCMAGQPCSAPAAGAVLAFVRGTHVARATVHADGTYRVRLSPGTYEVRASYRRVEPSAVLVRSGAPRRADFSIDTGIR